MLKFTYKLDFFVVWGFILYFLVLYIKTFRVLKFLINSEFIFLFIFLIFRVVCFSYENTFLLVFLTVLACEVSIGLALLVGFIRFKDKKNVKSSIFVGF